MVVAGNVVNPWAWYMKLGMGRDCVDGSSPMLLLKILDLSTVVPESGKLLMPL